VQKDWFVKCSKDKGGEAGFHKDEDDDTDKEGVAGNGSGSQRFGLCDNILPLCIAAVNHIG
jgi:hypothetical protein